MTRYVKVGVPVAATRCAHSVTVVLKVFAQLGLVSVVSASALRVRVFRVFPPTGARDR